MGTATNKPKQQQQQLTPTTTTISNIKLPILKKEEYDIWAIGWEHYLEYIDNDVLEEHLEEDLNGMDYAKEIWEAIRTSSEGLEKGYDRFQQLLSQLEAHSAEVSTKDANHNRFSKTDNFKGVPHPLTGDYTPKPQEEIDDSLTNVNSVRPKVNTGSSNVNTVRLVSHVPTRTQYSFSPKDPQGNWGTAYLPLKNMEDRAQGILFHETECLVVTPDFKMLMKSDTSYRSSRQHNMYSFDIKTPGPVKSFAYLIAKATSNESKLWYRRLVHPSLRGYAIRLARKCCPSCADMSSVLRGYAIRRARICYPSCADMSSVLRGRVVRLARICHTS
ncbi:hypothetical protein Tco_0408521 [Tanacetum coccineum]